jgi:hypothetical protein
VTRYNTDAMVAIESIDIAADGTSYNSMRTAIDIAIQPLEMHLRVVKTYPNGISKLQLHDNAGAICAEWHDTLRGPCSDCGQVIDRYNRGGLRYKICPACAKKIPDPYGDTLALLNQGG